MTCAQIQDQIEAVAADEQPVTEEFRRHVEGCVRCASALATARRVEAMLESWEAPPAPPRFTAAVSSRIRSERWRSEQQVDRVFNLLLVCGLLVVVGGIVALFNFSTVASAISRGVDFVARAGEHQPSPAVPSLVTYVVGSAFFGTALAAWWWAERRFST
ncbi:MAG TPA: hypothetical protein VL484_18705 [Vicinamibacterales bacterium]|jgi:hypothetical protein|nr:hypothetical protein [Vicinamibacterales bacterium]